MLLSMARVLPFDGARLFLGRGGGRRAGRAGRGDHRRLVMAAPAQVGRLRGLGQAGDDGPCGGRLGVLRGLDGVIAGAVQRRRRAEVQGALALHADHGHQVIPGHAQGGLALAGLDRALVGRQQRDAQAALTRANSTISCAWRGTAMTRPMGLPASGATGVPWALVCAWACSRTTDSTLALDTTVLATGMYSRGSLVGVGLPAPGLARAATTAVG